MLRHSASRRLALISAAAAVLFVLPACGAPGADNSNASQESNTLKPVKPTSPIALTMLDGAGNLTGAKVIYEKFAKEHPELVSKISYESASAPDVAGKIRAQQMANKVDISVVLGGPDVLGGASGQNLLLKLEPDYSSSLPDLNSVYDQGRMDFQNQGNGFGLVNRFDQAGPMLAHQPGTLPQPPDTPQALLDWAKAHPGKFSYAQPPNSGPGRTFMMSLPYMLGDSDPTDPEKGWDKTWAYLKELGKYISSYPASTTILNQQFGAGQLQLVPTIVGFDVNARKDGTWPPTTTMALFSDQHWIADGHYMMIPKGVSAETLYVALELIKFTVQPDQQLLTYGTGSLTTANKDNQVSQAAPEAQAFIQKWGRPDFYPTAFKTGATHTPLPAAKQVKAFEIWQREVGANVGK